MVSRILAWRGVVSEPGDDVEHGRKSVFLQQLIPCEFVGEPVVDDTWNAVQRLSPIQRAVVVLRFYEDLPLTEIAQAVGRPDSTVRSDLRRALQHLRQELNNDR